MKETPTIFFYLREKKKDFKSRFYFSNKIINIFFTPSHFQSSSSVALVSDKWHKESGIHHFISFQVCLILSFLFPVHVLFTSFPFHLHVDALLPYVSSSYTVRNGHLIFKIRKFWISLSFSSSRLNKNSQGSPMLRTSVGSQVYNRRHLNSYIQSITKVAGKMIGYFYHSRNYLVPAMFYLYKNHIRPKIEYCDSIDIFMASVQPRYIL